ncbi:MAG: glycoside hydrolase family 13 protein [Clostridia bacterium]|nr:glycoside hydrolase family 13 protein [Clostridia bacterium]
MIGHIRYNSRDLGCKKPFGAVTDDTSVEFTLYTDLAGATKVALCIFPDAGEETEYLLTPGAAEGGWVPWRLTLPCRNAGLWFYHFFISYQGNRYGIYRDDHNRPALAGDCWQLTVYSADYEPPSVAEGSVFYQIFPDRFHKSGSPDLRDKLRPFSVHAATDEVPEWRPGPSGKIENNDFYGGNFKGIEEKLPYLADLGIDAIYLNPICMAWSNHRYDTADYKRCDPMLGDDADFTSLCDAAHSHGIRIILDGVFSHTGSRSIYFDALGEFGDGALSAGKDSPYYDWYRFRTYPYDYECWWDVKTLPCVEEMHPAYLDYILRDEDCVVAHWLRLGADGYRLDVADELPDAFIAELRDRIRREKPGALLIGEVWEDASNKVSYGKRRRYLFGDELDSVMNYPFRTAILNYAAGGPAEELAACVMQIAENYPAPILNRLLNSLSTHDTERVFTRLGGLSYSTREERSRALIWGDLYETTLERLRIAVFLQFTLPGCPCIFYGDEAGLQGYEDPFCRRYYPWGHEDPRTMGLHKTLAAVRHAHKALLAGNVEILRADADALIFRRTAADETLLICHVRQSAMDIPGKLIFGEHTENCGDLVHIPADGFAILAI